MVGVDLFAGAGGLSLGARMAGVDVRLAIEADPHAAATYAHNHPQTQVVVKDIRKVARIDVPRNGGTVLFGGPPCQGFSTSNQRNRNGRNPDNWLFREFIRLVRQWEPEWVVFENVRGIIETEDGRFLDHVIENLQEARFAVSSWVLNAADFGVPQRRSRVFVIGSREGCKIETPEPTCSDHLTVHEALSDLPRLPNGASDSRLPYRHGPHSKYAQSMRRGLKSCANHLVTRNAPHIVRRYQYVPQGGNWEDIPPRLMRNYRDRRKCHTGIYHRLRNSRPAIVIGNFRKNMLIHPNEDRGLSVREAARLQSFPDCYEFKGSIGFQQQQVGNAVPPLLAHAVFARVTAILRVGDDLG